MHMIQVYHHDGQGYDASPMVGTNAMLWVRASTTMPFY